MTTSGYTSRTLSAFDREFFKSDRALSSIGSGELGGKALGLALLHELVRERSDLASVADFRIDVPRAVVLTTSVFDAVMNRNGLDPSELAEQTDEDIAQAFQRAELPVEILDDLHALVETADVPLAVRSSGVLEDAMFRPFAGVYGTKKTPNNQPDPHERFVRLAEAIKYVLATTFQSTARNYLRASGQGLGDEKMAVIVQKCVGHERGERFYPEVSGVGRSYNYYPFPPARPQERVVHLALGLGKTIVDGGICWAYSPAWPRCPPPFHSARALLHKTQMQFWAVNTGARPEFDPTSETEFLVQADLRAAEHDGALDLVASTYDASSDRLDPGIGAPGPRAITFEPLLDVATYRLNDAIQTVMAMGEEALGTSVEIEFAATFPAAPEDGPARLALLQLRPMVVSDRQVDLDESELNNDHTLLTSRRAIGNGVLDHVRDIVYLKPNTFERSGTESIALELEPINQMLVDGARPYVLIGFGRWGSSIPSLGVPVDWAQISGAAVLVEATLPDMIVEPSQGSHFFHNLSSFHVCCLTVRPHDRTRIDWDWLAAQPAAHETAFIRHVRLEQPLLVKVDGRTGRGGIWHTG